MSEQEREVIEAARDWYAAQSGTRTAREDAYHRLSRAVRELGRSAGV